MLNKTGEVSTLVEFISQIGRHTVLAHINHSGDNFN